MIRLDGIDPSFTDSRTNTDLSPQPTSTESITVQELMVSPGELVHGGPMEGGHDELSRRTTEKVTPLLPKKLRQRVDRIAGVLGDIQSESAAQPDVKDAVANSARWNRRLFVGIASVLSEAESRGAKRAPSPLDEYIGMIVSATNVQMTSLDQALRMNSVPAVMDGHEPDEEQQRYAELQDLRQQVVRAYGYALQFVEPERPDGYIPGRPPRTQELTSVTPDQDDNESNVVYLHGSA